MKMITLSPVERDLRTQQFLLSLKIGGSDQSFIVKRSWESMCDFFKDHIPDHTLSVAEQTDQEVDSQLSALLQDDKTAFALLSFLDDSETQLQRLRGKQLLGEILRLTGTVEGLDVRMAAIEAQLTHTLRLLEGVLVREGSATDAAADSALPSPPPPQLPQLLSSLSGELSEGDVKPTATTPPTPGASSRHTHAHVLPLPSYICDLPPAPLPPSPLVEAVPVDWAALETELLSLFASVRALDPLLVPLVGPFLPSAAAAQEREEALGVVRRGLRLSGGGVVGLDGGVAELVPPLPHDPLCLFVLSSRAGAGGGGGGGGVVPWYVALCEALLIMKDKTDASAAAALAVDASAAAAAAAAAAAVGLEESAEGSSRTSSPILGIAPPSPALGALRIADIKCYRLPAQTSNHNHNNANTSSSGGLHAAFSQSLSPATTSSTALHPSALGIAASASMSASGTTNNSNAFALSAANTPRATFQQPLQPSPQQAAQQQAHRVAVEVSGPLTGSVRVQVEALCRPQHVLSCFVEELAALVDRVKGDGRGLFRLSLLLIRLWLAYCSHDAPGAAAWDDEGLGWEAVCVCVCMVFNVHHAHIASPAHALYFFLLEMGAYLSRGASSGNNGGGFVLTIQGGVWCDGSGSAPLLAPPSSQHLVPPGLTEKYAQMLQKDRGYARHTHFPGSSASAPFALLQGGLDILCPVSQRNLGGRGGARLRAAVIRAAQLMREDLASFNSGAILTVNGSNSCRLLRGLVRAHALVPQLNPNPSPSLSAGSGGSRLSTALDFVAFTADGDEARGLGVVGEGGVLVACIETLLTRGPLPVGEVGKALTEMCGLQTLSVQLKERFGGLKKFLERYAHVFLFGGDHPFNPHIYLRAALGGLGATARGVVPVQVLMAFKRTGKKTNKGALAGDADNMLGAANAGYGSFGNGGGAKAWELLGMSVDKIRNLANTPGPRYHDLIGNPNAGNPYQGHTQPGRGSYDPYAGGNANTSNSYYNAAAVPRPPPSTPPSYYGHGAMSNPNANLNANARGGFGQAFFDMPEDNSRYRRPPSLPFGQQSSADRSPRALARMHLDSWADGDREASYPAYQPFGSGSSSNNHFPY